jgi:dehydrogenase/reductase SDR family member 12
MGASQSFSKLAVVQWYFSGTSKYGKKGYDAASSLFKSSDMVDMAGKHVAVTGANSGIGFATAKCFAERNAEVHLLCRSQSKADAARDKITEMTGNKNVHAHVCDASTLSSIRTFAVEFGKKFTQLNVLVNNAGGMPAERTTTAEGHDSIMASALGGTMLLTAVMLPFLKKAGDSCGRVVNVVSGGAFTVTCPDPKRLDMKEDKYDPTAFYAFSKRAQILLTELWAQKYKEEYPTVRFYSMHPGWATTEGVADALEGGRLGLSSTNGFRSADEGADTIVYLGCTENPDTISQASNGKLWFDRSIAAPAPYIGTGTNSKVQEELWVEACKYVGGLGDTPDAPDAPAATPTAEV